MSIFDFLTKRETVADNGKQNTEKQMAEELWDHIKEDFGGEPEEGSALAIFGGILERTAEKHAQAQYQETPEAVDALYRFYVSPDSMEAYVCVLPPFHGGKEMTREDIAENMRYEGISSGILDDAATELADGKNYLHIVKIAQGKPACDGQDGEIEELYERVSAHMLELDEKAMLSGVDFRSCNPVQPIHAGEPVCRIKQPVAAQDGMDVLGRTLPGKGGEAADVPAGEHTRLSEDGTALLAEIDGIVLVKGENFYIQSLNIVPGNVTASSGKLEYDGNVLIRGNVETGAAIHAAGDVIVEGEIQDAQILSGGTIRAYQGVKGSSGVELKAAKQIQCMAVENASVTAGEDIYAEVIANSTLVSEGGSVFALMGRGLLFGGDIKAHSCVYAKKIGNVSGCVNKLMLGYDSVLDERESKMRKELEDIRGTIEKLRKSISGMKAAGVNMKQEKREGLAMLAEQQALYEKMEKNKTKELKDVLREIHDTETGCISCEELHPVTEVRIGTEEMKINTEAADCRIRRYGAKIILR